MSNQESNGEHTAGAIADNPKPAPRAAQNTARSPGFLHNVAYVWFAYLISVITGFLMPRMISDRLGVNSLGVWDFTWSVVSYFGIIQLGLGSSVVRYVARHRAAADHKALSISVSTIGLFFKISGFVILLATACVSLLIVPFFADRLGEHLVSAQQVIFILGAEMAFCVMLTVYGGVIAGCNRWDVHNSISALSNIGTVLAMVVVVLVGGGLPALALVHFVFAVSGDILRWRLSRRICPELQVNYKNATLSVWLEQARFSAKNLIPSIGDLLSNQFLAILITAHLGPAMLAIYSRPKNLIRQLQTMAGKFGNVFVPAASSMQAHGRHDALQTMFLNGGVSMAALMGPAVVVLIVFGDAIIHLWMGSEFVFPGLIPVLGISGFFSCVNEPAWSILAGLNRHGLLAWVRLAGALCSSIVLGIGLWAFDISLLMAALIFAIPVTLAEAVAVPVLACRILGVPLASYCRRVIAKPVLCCMPFLALAFLARWVLPQSLVLFLAASAVSTAALVVTFWCFLLPSDLKERICARWKRKVAVD